MDNVQDVQFELQRGSNEVGLNGGREVHQALMEYLWLLDHLLQNDDYYVQCGLLYSYGQCVLETFGET